MIDYIKFTKHYNDETRHNGESRKLEGFTKKLFKILIDEHSKTMIEDTVI